MPLFRRLRGTGFTNRNRKEYTGINLGRLSGFPEGAQITPEKLLMEGVIKRISRDGIKILGSGDAVPRAEIVAHKFSAGARAKIETAGGRCILVADLKKQRSREPEEIR